MRIAPPARPLRAACFTALALACLAGLGFGLALGTWPETPRRILEFAGYLLFVVLSLEALDSCRRGGISAAPGGRS